MLNLPEGKRSIMKLSHRMVKNFCGMLSMTGKLDFPQLNEVNNSGVRVSVRKSSEPGQPCGMIVSAATSLWLPLPPHHVFSFFREEKTRVQVNQTIYIFRKMWTYISFFCMWNNKGKRVKEYKLAIAISFFIYSLKRSCFETI